MDYKDFEQLVEDAIESMPEDFLKVMENVSVVVEDWPRRDQLARIWRKGQRGMLLGLYEGIPKTKRGRYGIGGHLPDKITIYRIPILRIARSKEHVKVIVQSTVMHEIAHHFGMDEHQVRHAESDRRKKRLN